MKIGEISGFDIVGIIEELRYTPILFVVGMGKYKIEIINTDEIGNIIKIENVLKSFQNKIDTVKEQIEYTNNQLKSAKEELDKTITFDLADKIKELQKEKARIDSELDLDKQEIILDINEEQKSEEEREK